LELSGTNVRGQTAVGISRGRVEIEALDASLPASLVSLVYGPAAFFEPTGTIEVRAPNVELSAGGLIAKIEAEWRGAGGRFTGATSLGDYRIDITGDGANATIRLSTLRGNLDLNGQGTWNVTGDGAIQFTGRAQPRGNAGPLEPLLRALGPDLGGGQRQIRFNARVPLVRQLGF
jgi:general secretion pathway protein N